MSMFSIFDIAGSALSAQSQRMNVTASNLANADTTSGPDNEAYRARQVVFESQYQTGSNIGACASARWSKTARRCARNTAPATRWPTSRAT
jgi:flagellar basal body rod protein FlgC